MRPDHEKPVSPPAPARSKRSEDRRSHPRIEVRLPLEIHLQGNSIVGETINLSASGLYCMVVNPVSEMSRFAVTLNLPKNDSRPAESVSCRAVVVRCLPTEGGKQHRLGLFFYEMEELDREHLEDYLFGSMPHAGEH